jgi:catechol 2,3-dioxygenase-like lactoylglutathione lyase family enzyme
MKLHHVALTVKDLSVSIPFYHNLFRFTEVKRFRRDDMNATACLLQGDNIIIELWQFDDYKQGMREGLPISGIKHIAFTDDNVELVHKTFTEKGITCTPVQKGASGGIYFFLSDPDENQIEIYKPPNTKYF